MRCESALPNEKPTTISPEEYKKCEHQGHVVRKDQRDKPKSEVKADSREGLPVPGPQ
jgi:hypothetical protein